MLIYRYFPHGSRNIKDCTPIQNLVSVPKIDLFDKMYTFFHDQEPLVLDLLPKVPSGQDNIPFNGYRLLASNYCNRFDRVIVVHSEQNSQQVKWLDNNGAVPVYWWSHALIALDWFRYAKIDPLLHVSDTVPAIDFIIYNRAWQGSREYRLKFAELLVNTGLHSKTKMNFNAWDDGHYSNHKFANHTLAIDRFDLEQYFASEQIGSHASADYVASDYQDSFIEIVLETLFDDCRLHLTEKTLRPIACGQPFLVAGTAGTLRYLRRYGFQTFSPWIDEAYDDILDPLDRLKAITATMQQISSLGSKQKLVLAKQLRTVTEFNRKRFFSPDFFNLVVTEFQDNFNQAANVMKQHQQGFYFKLFLSKFDHATMTAPISAQDLAVMWQKLQNPVI